MRRFSLSVAEYGDDTLIERRSATNLFAASRELKLTASADVGSSLALRLVLRRAFMPIASDKTILYRLYKPNPLS
jgi:hypothetical protein